MRARLYTMLIVLLTATSGSTAKADQPPTPQPEPSVVSKDVAAFFRRHCTKCHGGADPESGLALDKLAGSDVVARQRKTFKELLSRLRSGSMPPKKEPRPKQADVDRIAAWIEVQLNSYDCSGPVDPGRVTIRRLNRAEYKNTIRDLVGVEFQPADDFPADDVGYGFDNIGDVLSLSPLLFEKYLAAAETIADQAITTPDELEAPTAKLPSDKLAGGRAHGSGRVLASSGRVTATHRFPSEGRYLLKVTAFADQAGDELAKMDMRIDNRVIKLVNVAAVENEPEVYLAQAKVGAGVRQLAMGFLNDYYNPQSPNPEDRDRNLYVERIEVVGPLDEHLARLPQRHRRIVPAQPDQTDKPAQLNRILREFATRAYRRPPTDEEVGRLVQLAERVEASGDSFEAGIQVAIQAVLVSPHFLFRGEHDPEPDNPAAVHPVSEYELASRLAYFLWSTMPDDELFDHARRGKLRENLAGQVRRMLADAKSRGLVENFGGQWLQTRRLALAAPDPQQFPEFDDALRRAMQTETELFFAAMIREDRPIGELIDGRFTFLNERLARHYGISGVRGEEFRKVSLTDPRRGGVLTHASVLTITSLPTRTSPVKRGKWILEQILGEPPPPPPPDVPELEESAELTGTLRERLKQHREKESCAVCHRRMDPLGFALENYDAIGAWRETEGKHRIDPSGELPDGSRFAGPVDLKGVLRSRKGAFRRVLAENLLTYALGRGIEYYDQCAMDEITKQAAAGGDRFSSLVLAIVESDPFQLRRGDGGQP